jgi:hypothetical protein
VDEGAFLVRDLAREVTDRARSRADHGRRVGSPEREVADLGVSKRFQVPPGWFPLDDLERGWLSAPLARQHP